MSKSETRDNMRIDWDVPIEMDDGLILRADIFRPIDDSIKYPVIMSHGPYAKGLATQDGYPTVWGMLIADHPDVAEGSTNQYQSWEVVDPEKWVPHGYVCVRVDSRGAGRSPGFIDHWSPRESKDYYDCIEWAAVQAWSDGKVGLNGISYYAINQWHVASLNPPHLEAICTWEGAADFYRDMSRHGGILCTFLANWYDMQVKTVQHGLGDNGPNNRVTGDTVCGPATLSDEELEENRIDLGAKINQHPFDGDYYRERSANLSNVTVPLLSAANWGGQGLHPRGNIEGFLQAASSQKWLATHGLEHWTHFYTDYGRQLQMAFFDHFLKGEDNGWAERPPITLQVRHVDHFEQRFEKAWPIDRTKWTPHYLKPQTMELTTSTPSDDQSINYEGFSDGVTFLTGPMTDETEITGPIKAKMYVSSETKDADLFLVMRLFTPDLKEIVFPGTLDPNTPIAQGWLRASRRKLDPEKSTEYRPYHTHDEDQFLVPGDIYELDIEVWPTCIVVPVGYRIGLSVRGKDYVYPGQTEFRLSNMKNNFTGCGPFLHDDPVDRPAEIFGKSVTVHCSPEHPSHLILPIIPAD